MAEDFTTLTGNNGIRSINEKQSAGSGTSLRASETTVGRVSMNMRTDTLPSNSSVAERTPQTTSLRDLESGDTSKSVHEVARKKKRRTKAETKMLGENMLLALRRGYSLPSLYIIFGIYSCTIGPLIVKYLSSVNPQEFSQTKHVVKSKSIGSSIKDLIKSDYYEIQRASNGGILVNPTSLKDIHHALGITE